MTPGRRTARISSPSSSRRHARRLSAWLGRRAGSSYGDADQRVVAVDLYEQRKHTIDEICRTLGISKPTLYAYVREKRA